MTDSAEPVIVFVSYSSGDDEYVEKLNSRLFDAFSPLQIHSRPLEVEPMWSQFTAVDATVILALLSPNYLSKFNPEFAQQMLGAAGRRKTPVVPIILEPCAWEQTQFASYQVWPMDGTPISTWKDDRAYDAIVQGLQVFLKRKAAKKTSPRSSAHPSPLTPPRVPGRRVTDFRFSSEAARVVAGAETVQPSQDFLTSEALLYAALIHRKQAPRKTTEFFPVFRTGELWPNLVEPKFPDRAERLGVRTTHLTTGGTAVMDLALRAALATTGRGIISLRHLVFGLIQPVDSASKDAMLAELGLDVSTLGAEYFNYLRVHLPLLNELPKWESLVRRTKAAREIVSYAPTYASDHAPASDDLLGFEKDARALASLIASSQTRPPLAIGLFGDWGSGKSFFMRMIREFVAQTAERAAKAKAAKRSTVFYGNVVQIEFNAWHYIEGNLWASLVEHIFSNLRLRPDDERDDKELEKKRAELLKMLRVEEQQRDAAKAAQDTAQKAADDARAAREKKIEERVKLQLAKTNDWTAAFSPEDRARLGISEETVKSIGRIRDHGKLWWVAGGQIVAAFKLLRGQKGPTLRFALLVLLLTILLPYGAYRLAQWIGIDEIKAVAGSLPLALAFISTITPWITKAGRLASTIEAKHRELELRREQHALAIDQEIAALSRNVEQAEAKALQAGQRIEAIREEMNQLSSATIFSNFLEERAASSDYRRHLGVLANIRRDFERMARLLQKQADDPAQPALIERIVLYVDDLDRCPAKRVVQVLQAIHLLLAFPIFVVVVGVDARWIARALQTEYDTLLGHADDGLDESLGAEATAHDYLQKIFQVPFWIRSMNDKTCIQFIEGLTTPKQAVQQVQQTVSNEVQQARASVIVKTQEKAAEVQELTETTIELEEKGKKIEIEKPPADDDLNPLALQILGDEVQLMNALVPLLGRSPRAVKRFVNCYQLIKISVDAAELAPFLTDPAATLYFKPVMFLLAIVTGTPEFGEKLLDALEKDTTTEIDALLQTWPAVFGEAFLDERSRIGAALKQFATNDAEAWRPVALQNAAHVVRRYSFRAGYAAAQREDREPRKGMPKHEMNVNVNVAPEATA